MSGRSYLPGQLLQDNLCWETFAVHRPLEHCQHCHCRHMSAPARVPAQTNIMGILIASCHGSTRSSQEAQEPILLPSMDSVSCHSTCHQSTRSCVVHPYRS